MILMADQLILIANPALASMERRNTNQKEKQSFLIIKKEKEGFLKPTVVNVLVVEKALSNS